MRHLPGEEGNGRERWPLGVAIGLSGHLDFRTLIWEARSSSAIGEATDWPVHASRKWKPPIQRQLGGWWKRNASRKRKPPIQRQLGGGGSGMPA